MRYRLRWLIVMIGIALASAALIGFANQPGAQETQIPQSDYPVKAEESDTLKAAKATLEKLVRSYEQEIEQEFLSNVSDRYLRQYLDFKSMIENDFRTFDVIRIQYWIDDAEEEANRASLNVHWERSWMPSMGMGAGTPALTTGRSKFVFEVAEDGKAVLDDQQGDVLFGVTP